MKNRIAVFILTIIFSSTLLSAGIPHPIYINITDYDGTIPAENSIQFSATNAQGDYLTETSPDCYYYTTDNHGVIKINAGNFSTDWLPADNLTVTIDHESDRTAEINFLLSSEGYDIYPQIVLLNNPTINPNPAQLVYPELGAVVPTTVTIQWQSDGEPTPDGYKLYVGTNGNGTSTPDNYIDGIILTAENYELTGLEFSTQYFWQIIPFTNERNGQNITRNNVNRNNRSDATNCPIWNFTTEEVSFIPPTNLSAEMLGFTVVLEWDSPLLRDLNGYNIYRNEEFLTTTSTTSYTDSNVLEDSTYTYEVTAVYTNPQGESASSNPATITVFFPDGNDTPQTATVIETVPAALDELSINHEGDIDWFRVFLVENTSWVLYTQPSEESNLDTELWLYGPHEADGSDIIPGTFIASNDDGHGSFQPEIEFIAPADGYYFLRIANYQNDPERSLIGGYSLHIDYNLVQMGTISGNVWNDVDMLPIEGARIMVGNPGPVGYTDEAGDYSFEVPAGNYTVFCVAYGYFTVNENEVVITHGENTIVDFAMLPNPDVDFNDTPQTATQLTLPIISEPYEIGIYGDTDWYRFYLNGDTEIQIFTELINESDLDPKAWLYGPSNEDGSNVEIDDYIAADDDSHGDSQPYISMQIEESGYYFLNIAYWQNGPDSRQFTGEYALTVISNEAPGVLSGNVSTIYGDLPINMPTIEINDIFTEIDEFGNYSVELNPGIYSVSCSAPDYSTVTYENIQIITAETTVQNFVLTPSELGPAPVLNGYVTEMNTINLEWTDADPSHCAISYHNNNAYSGNIQQFGYGYGTIFDLSIYQDYQLTGIDFCHNSFGIEGTHNYNIHVIDWETFQPIEVLTGLSTTVNNGWENSVSLGNLSAVQTVGIFIEPLSNDTDNAYPNVAFDDANSGASVLLDLLSDNPDDYTLADGDFLINLWLSDNNGEIRQKAVRYVHPQTNSRTFLGYRLYINNEAEEELLTVNQIALEDVADGNYSIFISKVFDTHESYPSNVVSFTIDNYQVDEDFESGDFSQHNWQTGGEESWTVDNSDFFSGSYSAVSGAITDNQESELNLVLNIMNTGIIKFYLKTSTESNQDFLFFFIDDQLISSWSGEQEWFLFTTEIQSGIHSLTWKYNKDDTNSHGNDQIRIDALSFSEFNYILPPSTFSATGGIEYIQLNWSTPFDEANILGYNLFREGNQINDDLITSVSYTDFDVVPDQSYSYFVTAIYTGNIESVPSEPDTATAEAFVLNPPQNLSYSLDNNDVILEWSSPASDVNLSRNSCKIKKLRNRELIGYNIYKNNTILTGLTNPGQLTFTDYDLPTGSFTYYITAVYNEGESEPSNSVVVEITGTNNANASFTTDLLGVYPNPFNPQTTISFSLEKNSFITISIFNNKGQLVRELISEDFRAGTHTIVWNGLNSYGEKISSGIYFIRMNTPDFSKIHKTIMLK
ncbi:MAG: carboxypeptidase regulatory-like domain-containing protein [Candidatus Cloacimonetes bacterium]|nr:carboxypeptidase regulatory-like domain-containing protein [Candidatus Cloacimonadota bacterium]